MAGLGGESFSGPFDPIQQVSYALLHGTRNYPPAFADSGPSGDFASQSLPARSCMYMGLMYEVFKSYPWLIPN